MFVELPTTGFQRLLQRSLSPHTWSNQAGHPIGATDDLHTFSLLFPGAVNDAETQSNDEQGPRSRWSSGKEKVSQDVDASHPLPDVRVIISQEATLTTAPSILFDSNANSHCDGGRRADGDLRARHRRSLSSQEPSLDTASSPYRRSSISGTHEHRGEDVCAKNRKIFFSGLLENEARRNAPRFAFTPGASNLRAVDESNQGKDAKDIVECIFGSSGLPSTETTKFHLQPPREIYSKSGRASRESLGQGQNHQKPLSTTLDPASKRAEPVPTCDPQGQGSDLPTAEYLTLLVTRIFAVDPSRTCDSEDEPHQPTLASTTEPATEEAYRAHANEYGHRQSAKSIQPKAPKYAVTLVLDVPSSLHHTRESHAIVGKGTEAAYSSHRGMEHMEDPHNDVESGTQYVMAHWVNLMRALRSLETSVRAHRSRRLLFNPPRIRATESSSQRRRSIPGIALSDEGDPRQGGKHGSQTPAALSPERNAMLDHAAVVVQRLRTAFQIRRVSLESKRWGTWTSEARLLSACLGGKEQSFLLFNVLTAFLGNQPYWLDSVARKYIKHKKGTEKAATSSEDAIQNRTVIVCSNANMGRRLIYTLSSFIPARTGFMDRSWPHSKSPRSNMSVSQSPPMPGHAARAPSLRHSVGRRAGVTTSFITRSLGASHSNGPSLAGSLDTLQYPQLQHVRRPSDARSIRSLAMPVPPADYRVPKSSAGVVSATVPIRQVSTFSAPSQRGTSAEPRPGSSGNLAAMSLKRALSRSESSNLGSPTSPSQTGWGSVMSGFWSLRRRSSTERSDVVGSSDDGLGISGFPQSPKNLSQPPDLIGDNTTKSRHTHIPSAAVDEPLSPTSVASESVIAWKTPAKDIPYGLRLEEYPVKLSVDEEDGVVDVELPPDEFYPSSFDSSNTNTAASSFNDHLSVYGRHSSHGRPPAPSHGPKEVAGYLHTYHPDFILQAVKPYWKLRSDVIRSLRDEASQSPQPSGRFSALVADATNFHITRFTLDHDLIREEPIMDLDPTLVDAVENLLSQDDEVPSDKECKRIIWSALETVVKSVIAEEESDEDESGRNDNTLREGIRRWIREQGMGR